MSFDLRNLSARQQLIIMVFIYVFVVALATRYCNMYLTLGMSLYSAWIGYIMPKLISNIRGGF